MRELRSGVHQAKFVDAARGSQHINFARITTACNNRYPKSPAMRLINTRTLNLEQFHGSDVPRFAAVSHTWGPAEDEVFFQDMSANRSSAMEKPGFGKIRGACKLAISENLEYVYIDTCCIDKTCSAELNEAINSMFSLFQLATTCYVYLSDMLPSSEIEKSLEYDGPFPPVSMVYTGLDTVGTHRSTRFTLLRLRVEFSWHQKRASG